MNYIIATVENHHVLARYALFLVSHITGHLERSRQFASLTCRKSFNKVPELMSND